MTNAFLHSMIKLMNESAQRGIVDPKIIIGGVIAAIVIFLIATGSFNFSASVNKNNNQQINQSQPQATSTPESKPKTYQSEQYGISLEYPASWSLKETPAQGYIAGFFSPKEGSNDNYIESLGIKVVDISSQPNITLQEAADLWENQTKKAESTFVVADRKSSTVAGESAKDILYSFKNQGDSGKGMVRVTLKNKKAYIFQYNALEKDYDKYLSIIETILSSVKF